MPTYIIDDYTSFCKCFIAFFCKFNMNAARKLSNVKANEAPVQEKPHNGTRKNEQAQCAAVDHNIHDGKNGTASRIE